MIKISGLRLSPGEPESALNSKIRKELSAPHKGFRIIRKSIDARKKSDVVVVYTVVVETDNDEKVLKHSRSKKISAYFESHYQFPVQHIRFPRRPVIVGSGPAGLFCGLMLARAGAMPIILERGMDVEQRTSDVSDLWNKGILNPESNVQFGEGGAGTFSDGKLNTGVNNAKIPFILQEFAKHGAPSEILYDAAPHVGTDYLKRVVRNIREELLSLGAEVRFRHCMTDLVIQNNQVTGVHVASPEGDYTLDTGHLILAVGHSARDTFEMLYNKGVPMEQKQFAMGVRIEHLQKDISFSQYGAAAEDLPAASYKLSHHAENGHSAFSFCVCPGGQVVAAASELGRLCTNGMSNHARAEKNINGALLVSVPTSCFPSDHPLAGMHLQRKLEEQAYKLGGENYHAPCQRVEDFLLHKPSQGPGKVMPSYKPGVCWSDLHACLPKFMTDTLEIAIPVLGKKLLGFDDPDAVLSAIESRSSSPIRIPRDSSCQSTIAGLYPCGEGAGYAGGIMSAASDGIKVAECVCSSLEL